MEEDGDFIERPSFNRLIIKSPTSRNVFCPFTLKSRHAPGNEYQNANLFIRQRNVVVSLIEDIQQDILPVIDEKGNVSATSFVKYCGSKVNSPDLGFGLLFKGFDFNSINRQQFRNTKIILRVSDESFQIDFSNQYSEIFNMLNNLNKCVLRLLLNLLVSRTTLSIDFIMLAFIETLSSFHSTEILTSLEKVLNMLFDKMMLKGKYKHFLNEDVTIHNQFNDSNSKTLIRMKGNVTSYLCEFLQTFDYASLMSGNNLAAVTWIPQYDEKTEVFVVFRSIAEGLQCRWRDSGSNDSASLCNLLYILQVLKNTSKTCRDFLLYWFLLYSNCAYERCCDLIQEELDGCMDHSKKLVRLSKDDYFIFDEDLRRELSYRGDVVEIKWHTLLYFLIISCFLKLGENSLAIQSCVAMRILVSTKRTSSLDGSLFGYTLLRCGLVNSALKQFLKSKDSLSVENSLLCIHLLTYMSTSSGRV